MHGNYRLLESSYTLGIDLMLYKRMTQLHKVGIVTYPPKLLDKSLRTDLIQLRMKEGLYSFSLFNKIPTITPELSQNSKKPHEAHL